MRLVADVGGTNTRIGLARDGKLLGESVRSFLNDDFASFTDVIAQYQRDASAVTLTDMAVAVAGPVGEGSARLTNRDWSFCTTDLSARYGNIPSLLLNDLGALGQAVPTFDQDSLHAIWGTDATNPQQALIVGVGTGFNVSPVLLRGGEPFCLNAELGHAALPVDIHHALANRISSAADEFMTVEHLFSGRGLSRAYALVTKDPMPPKHVLSADMGAAQIKFAEFYAELLAILTRNLLLSFLPEGGVYFAGGVARTLLTSPACDRFIQTYSAPMALADGLHAPVRVITDDAAALKGCARVVI
ncbi:glucokinase [Aliiroseovarius sp. KMU-50]|uniref:Glucokinase n=1 Tax=Aliiroseovarius salicola TaxID=3009082 RepID=A0ABT4W481_9RHOB|nr:glucokinase [Aliiroseovarius sp. KMU-50]MDA5095333.1 glucokinase [Aliiroseovarius sp. KMU-50]